jgi:hypothetical protein
MQLSPLPAPFAQLGGRRFSLYPPILNIEHNEWVFRRGTWSEFVIVNAKTGEEACIPRVFLGEASRIDDPVVIIGLKRELEWRDGAVCVHRCPVIELPVAVNDSRPASPRPPQPAPVVNIRLESRRETRMGWKVGIAVLVACAIVADIAREFQVRQRADAVRLSRSYLRINPSDDYSAVVKKLGMPAADRSLSADGGVYRSLSYPRRQFTIVLMGRTRQEAKYIGAIDAQGRVLDLARSSDGSDAGGLLRSAPRF